MSARSGAARTIGAMRITVVRTGGVAGIRREWTVVVEQQPDAASWRELLEHVPWEAPPAQDGRPDRYVYLIRSAQYEVQLGESALDGPWRELVERVRDAGA